MVIALAAMGTADRAEAQFRSASAVSLSGGARMYDQGGNLAVSLRTEFPVGDLLAVEFSGSVADPVEGAARSTASVLEAQLQLPVRLGEVLTPYAGAGIGFAKTYTGQNADSRAQTVLSASVGVRAGFSRELGLVADARFRGIGGAWEGDHVDLTVGMRYQFR
jgi:opacity protein-like surface antigen